MGDGGTGSRADDENKASSGFQRIVWFRHMIHRWQSSSSSNSGATTAKGSGDGDRGNEPGVSPDRNSGNNKDPLMPAPAPDCSAEPPPQRRPLLLPRVVEERREEGGGESDSPMTPVTPDAATPADVPRGCCPVYVGAERRRFVVPTAYLGMPVFRRLLEKAEEEFEFHYVAGGVTIPCDTEAFKYILLVMERHSRGLVDDEGNAKDDDGGERGGSSSSSSQAQPTTSSPADGGVTGANAEAVLHGRDDAVGNCGE